MTDTRYFDQHGDEVYKNHSPINKRPSDWYFLRGEPLARDQNYNLSPYSKGKRNSNFVNPSFVSNVVFYNDATLEKSKRSNNARTPNKKQKGYGTMDDYVKENWMPVKKPDHQKDVWEITRKPNEELENTWGNGRYYKPYNEWDDVSQRSQKSGYSQNRNPNRNEDRGWNYQERSVKSSQSQYNKENDARSQYSNYWNDWNADNVSNRSWTPRRDVDMRKQSNPYEDQNTRNKPSNNQYERDPQNYYRGERTPSWLDDKYSDNKSQSRYSRARSTWNVQPEQWTPWSQARQIDLTQVNKERTTPRRTEGQEKYNQQPWNDNNQPTEQVPCRKRSSCSQVVSWKQTADTGFSTPRSIKTVDRLNNMICDICVNNYLADQKKDARDREQRQDEILRLQQQEANKAQLAEIEKQRNEKAERFRKEQTDAIMRNRKEKERRQRLMDDEKNGYYEPIIFGEENWTDPRPK